MTCVLYDKRDRIAYVTLNRPRARNAIDLETHEALCETWADFRDDDDVDVAILTGAGDEAFCAGADLRTYIPPIIRGERRIRASERARFGSFEARRGYHHGDGGIVRLVNACGVGVASHLLLTAEPIDAAQRCSGTS
jgi:enoyl-CoA hydratase/carnithine racemase